MSTVDPTDSVRALLEQATMPLSTEEVVEALKDVHDEHQVRMSLDFWHRENEDAYRDGDGRWSWQGSRAG